MPRGRKAVVTPVNDVKETEVLEIEEGEDEDVESTDNGYSGVNIKLDMSYTLTSDKYQYIINKNGINRKTGEDTSVPISYHATVEQAINSIAERELRTRTAKSYSELFKNSEDVKTEIRNMYKLLNEIPNRPHR
jgi:hypothetical protein